jgi:hypothetical protein
LKDNGNKYCYKSVSRTRPKSLICVCINNKEYQRSGFEAPLTMFTFICDS